MTSEFVQILQTGHFHWVCASNIGSDPGVVNLYDSLQRGRGVSDDIRKQIECLVGEGYLTKINAVKVQNQTNGFDCGVFAVAFATALACHIAPETVEFNIPKMREHLKDCFDDHSFTPFPTKSKTSTATKK